jgi:hypothetical protein
VTLTALTTTRTYRTVTVGPDGTLVPQIGVETITVQDPAAVDLDETARLAALEHPGDWPAFWRSIRALYPEGRKPGVAELAELARRWLDTPHWGPATHDPETGLARGCDPLTGWAWSTLTRYLPPSPERVIAHTGDVICYATGAGVPFGGMVLRREGDRALVLVLVRGGSAHQFRDQVWVPVSNLTEW